MTLHRHGGKDWESDSACAWCECDRLRSRNTELEALTDKLIAEHIELKTRLAAANALLHDWREQWGDGAQPSGDLIDSTDAHLVRKQP